MPVILFCPCCASALDTESDKTEFECVTCGQTWTMVIDLVRQAASSIT